MSRKLLIVDDEDDFRSLIAAALTEYSQYHVTECSSGEEAIQVLERSTFDVIVLDYKMSGMSGLNVLQWMYEQKLETPVLMLTAAGSETIAVEAMKLGAYDYMRKEHVDVDHLPIIINGIYERYIFRKERDLEKLEHAKSVVNLQTFHATIDSVGLIAKNALGILSSYMREYESVLSPHVKEEGRKGFEKMFDELNREFGVISSSVQSMLNWSTMMHDKYAKQENGVNPNGVLESKTEDLKK